MEIVRDDGGVRAEYSTEQFDFPFLGDFDFCGRLWQTHI